MAKKLDVRNDFGVSLFSVDDTGKLLIESLGERVGINTINPQHTLDVDGSIGTNQLILKTATANRVLVSSANGSIVDSSLLTFDGTTLTANSALFSTSITTPSITRAGTISLSATGSNIITLSTNSAERIRVDASGNIGIGTTTPVSRLTANGVITVASGSAQSPSFSFIGDTSTGAFLTSNSTYAISVGGAKITEFGLATLPGDNLLEVFDENDDLVFGVSPFDGIGSLLEVFDQEGIPVFSVSETSIAIGTNTNIDGVLTFGDGSIPNVISDISVGQGANTAAPVSNIIRISEADYQALVSPDANTLYVIVD
jgi:hypothetical protein